MSVWESVKASGASFGKICTQESEICTMLGSWDQFGLARNEIIDDIILAIWLDQIRAKKNILICNQLKRKKYRNFDGNRKFFNSLTHNKHFTSNVLLLFNFILTL